MFKRKKTKIEPVTILSYEVNGYTIIELEDFILVTSDGVHYVKASR